MSKVFVSYAAADSEVVKEVLLGLRQAGIDTAYDLDIAARDFQSHINRSIEPADCILVFWSEAAARSEWVQEEVRRAIQAWSEDRLVLASLDRTELPPGLRDLEAVDLSLNRDRGIKRIVERVAEIAHPQSAEFAQVLESPMVLNDPPPARARATRQSFDLRHPPPVRRKAWVGWVTIPLLLAALFAPLFMFWSIGGDYSILSAPSASQVAAAVTLLAIFLALAWWAIRLISSRLRRTRSAALDLATLRHLEQGFAEESARYAPDHQVFVSYSHADWTLVDRIVRQIEDFGYKVWVDRHDESAGRFAGPIVRAIKSCNVVALMASRNSFSSDHVVREVYVAGGRKKPFISVLLDESEFPDEFEYFVEGFPRTAPPIQPEWLKAQLSRYVV
jgi:hypothetical protein